MTMAEEIEALRRLEVPDLARRYEELWGRPPRIKNREWLWKRCAWKVQERAFGGLSEKARDALEEYIADIDLPAPDRRRTVSGRLREDAPRAAPDDMPLGTILTRTWHDTEVSVRRVEGGFEYDGVVYPSLSAVARAVTGAKWNGRLFFGLTERKRRGK